MDRRPVGSRAFQLGGSQRPPAAAQSLKLRFPAARFAKLWQKGRRVRGTKATAQPLICMNQRALPAILALMMACVFPALAGETPAGTNGVARGNPLLEYKFANE